MNLPLWIRGWMGLSGSSALPLLGRAALLRRRLFASGFKGAMREHFGGILTPGLPFDVLGSVQPLYLVKVPRLS